VSLSLVQFYPKSQSIATSRAIGRLDGKYALAQLGQVGDILGEDLGRVGGGLAMPGISTPISHDEIADSVCS
jgi:hypothetical protein